MAMNGINGYNRQSVVDSHHLAQEFTSIPNQNNSSLRFYGNRIMSSQSEPLAGMAIASNRVPFAPNPYYEDNPTESSLFVPTNPLSSSAFSSGRSEPLGLSRSESLNASMNCTKSFDLICNESKVEFKLFIDYLENLRQNNEKIQINVLNELKQLNEVMTDMKRAVTEMPIRFADALTQCFDLMNNRSDSLSVDSEPEVIDIFDKIDISVDDRIGDNGFTELSETLSPNIISNDDKFVFPYDPYIDLDKWLKKD